MPPTSRPRITFDQFTQWPEKTTVSRESARFKIQLDRAARELEYELTRLQVETAKVSVGIDGTAFRRDGWPMAGARPNHPGVILTYDHPKKGVVRVLTDRYYDWVDNLIAITRTLEALRMMERYGTTGDGRQYEGFRALPATTTVTMSVESAATLIREAAQIKYRAELLVQDRELASIGVRAAIHNAHPDKNPGKADATEYFHRVEEARQVLSAHHGGGL